MFDIDRSNWDTSAGVTGLKSESTSPLWGRSKSKGVGLPCNFRAIESLRETNNRLDDAFDELGDE